MPRETENSVLLTFGTDSSDGVCLADIGAAFVKAVERFGGRDEDSRRILTDMVLQRRIGLLVMNWLRLEVAPCQRNVPHLIPGWVVAVVEDVQQTLGGAQKKIKLVSFLEDGVDQPIDGPTMCQRAKEMRSNLGLSDVPALLGRDEQGLETIPVEFRGQGRIVLAGTVLLDIEGEQHVAFLVWNGAAWVLRFGLYNNHRWYKSDRFAAYE